jgi:DNA repair protein RecN (Recombination protein N)
MLTHLTIKNYALIKHLEMTPSAHLNVITGETGAGKSIMLGAVGLLLGARADTKVLWDENDKCIVEGTFDISSYRLKSLFESEDLDYETVSVIRREISPGGKSRAFINDTPVTLDVMRKVGNRLMNIHSQHETLELGDKSFQLELIDAFAGNEKIKTNYTLTWKAYSKSKTIYEELLAESSTLKQEADFVRFQLEELVKADLDEHEQDKLESELKISEHAEEIKSKLNLVIGQMSQSDFSATAVLTEIRTQIQTIANYSPTYQQLLQRLESIRIEALDILNELEHEESKVEFDPKRNEDIKERLSLIYQLQQKHRKNTIKDLLEMQESLQQKSDKTENLDEALAAAKSDLLKTEQELNAKAEELSKTREKVFSALSKQVTQLLKELGIPDAVIKIENEKSSPTVAGIDNVEILFSANKGLAARPLAQVASGGEFSRLMFCVKYVMAEKTSMPTLILDEIDTGVSGEIAIRLGRMMKDIAQRHQLIAISHLPQIAAKADTHYFVFKDNSSTKTVSQIKELKEKERVEEIAKMIGGAKPSAKALENARELMEN